jgi:hypothetical protein
VEEVLDLRAALELVGPEGLLEIILAQRARLALPEEAATHERVRVVEAEGRVAQAEDEGLQLHLRP